MAIKNQGLTINIFATSAGEGYIGDSANINLWLIKDGAAPVGVTNAVSEPSAAAMPGLYELALTIAEMNANFVTVHGKSSTAGVTVWPAMIPTEQGILVTTSATVGNNLDAPISTTQTNIVNQVNLTSASETNIVNQVNSTSGVADISSLETLTHANSVSAGIVTVGDANWSSSAASNTQAELSAGALDALNIYDPPTRTEATTDKVEILNQVNSTSGVADISLLETLAHSNAVSGDIVSVGNANWSSSATRNTQAELSAGALAALNSYDSPTRAEATSDKSEIVDQVNATSADGSEVTVISQVNATSASETNIITQINAASADVVDQINSTSASEANIITQINTTSGVADVSSLETLAHSNAVSGGIVTVGDANWSSSASSNTQAELSAGALDALNIYDPPTRTEATTDKVEVITHVNTTSGDGDVTVVTQINATSASETNIVNQINTTSADISPLETLAHANAISASYNDITVAEILSGTVDGATLEVIYEKLLAHIEGRITRNGIVFTYFKQDNSTSAYALSGAAAERTRQ